MFSETMKRLRSKNGDTQESIAEKLNVPKRTYASWERGERAMPQDVLVRVANMYNVTIDYLLGREEQNISAVTLNGALKHGKTEFYDPPTSIHRWKSAVQIANSENYSESHGENSGITYDRPLYNTPEASRFANGSGMNHETPLDATPDQMTIEERFYRLSPERRKQAIDFLNFLEMQEDE